MKSKCPRLKPGLCSYVNESNNDFCVIKMTALSQR